MLVNIEKITNKAKFSADGQIDGAQQIYGADFGWARGSFRWLIPSEIFAMKVRTTTKYKHCCEFRCRILAVSNIFYYALPLQIWSFSFLCRLTCWYDNFHSYLYAGDKRNSFGFNVSSVREALVLAKIYQV